MFKLKYTKKSIESLKRFIDSYKNSFIKLIEDSWLIFEDILIQNYIEIWDRLYKNIKESIEKKFEEEVILWIVINEEKNEKYVTISINHFRLFVYYSENIELKERYIENIEFFKK